MNASLLCKGLFVAGAAVAVGVPCVTQAQTRLAYEGNFAPRNPFDEPGFQYFGSAVVTGDFDGDGDDDLVATESTNSRMRVMLGRHWTVGQSGFVIKFSSDNVSTPGFNGVVASGDFNGDGRDEVALGYYASSFNGMSEVGKVSIMQRDVSGDWAVQESIRLGTDGYPGTAAEHDRLGRSLASGDFDDDGYDDLAIGAYTRTVLNVESAGSVLVVYGSASGLGTARSKLFTRINDGQTTLPQDHDEFGDAIAVADFTGDGYDDLAIASPGARCPNAVNGGAVLVLRGSVNGLTDVQSREYFAGVDGVPGACTEDRLFGTALATGRFNNDSRPDLVIGATGDDEEHGSVTILPSSSTGPDSTGSTIFRSGDLPLPLTGGASRIGRNLTTGRLLGSSTRDSLVMGVEYDDVGGLSDAGSVWILHPASNGSGLSLTGAERWIQSNNLSLEPQAWGDRFGTAIAVGDYNSDGLADLAVGAPYRNEPDNHAGAVQIIYQSEFIFGNGFD